MNIYKNINDLTNYIEENLDTDIDYNVLSKFIGTNKYTMERIFSMICGITIKEYIKKRRLSNAGAEIYSNNSIKIIDIALKYGYNNPTSFSRSFEKFHNIKPSKVSTTTKLNIFPRIKLNENINMPKEISYEIIKLDTLKLYGLGIKTSNETIGIDAPLFVEKIDKKYSINKRQLKYGMISYDIERTTVKSYHCLYDEYIEGMEQIIIPESKWLRFRIYSQKPDDIQKESHKFYQEILPSCKYNLKEIPELEYYHDNITDFLVPIY